MALVFTKNSEISLFTLAGADRLGRLIISAATKWPYLSLVILGLFSGIAPLLGWLEGNWNNPALDLDVRRDVGWWNQFLLAFPALVFMAGTYFGAFPKTLRQLVDSGVILASDADWKTIRRSTKNYVSHPVVTWFPYVFGLGVVASSSVLFLSSNTWINITLFYAGWLVPVHVFLLFYFVAFVVLRIICVYLVLKKLFRFKVNIQPFHGDGCGGLKGLEVQSSKLTFGIIVIGGIVAIAMYTNIAIYDLDPFGVYNLWMLGLYVTAASLSFFLPLYATAKSMAEAKQQVMSQISDRVEKLNARQGLSPSDEKNLADYGDEDLKALEELKQTVRAMQVWPFTTGSIVRFIACVGIPVIVIGIQLVLNL